HLPEVRLQVAFVVPQQADIADEAPAVGVLEEGHAEIDRRDARLLVRGERAAAELHDREQIAGRRSAVEDLQEERGAVLPAPRRVGLELVAQSSETGELHAGEIDDRAVAYLARPIRGRNAGEQEPMG